MGVMQDGTKKEVADARQARLAEALRANLKRRKSQTRARRAAPDATEEETQGADERAGSED